MISHCLKALFNTLLKLCQGKLCRLRGYQLYGQGHISEEVTDVPHACACLMTVPSVLSCPTIEELPRFLVGQLANSLCLPCDNALAARNKEASLASQLLDEFKDGGVYHHAVVVIKYRKGGLPL